MNLEKITELLCLAGETIERARRSGRPLNSEERDAIAEARRIARQRLSPQMIRSIEREGAEEARQ